MEPMQDIKTVQKVCFGFFWTLWWWGVKGYSFSAFLSRGRHVLRSAKKYELRAMSAALLGRLICK